MTILLTGFMDFTSVIRSTGVGTSFGGIPFNAGDLTELRISTQNCRIGLKVDADPGNFKMRAYLEADFLRNAASGVEIGSRS